MFTMVCAMLSMGTPELHIRSPTSTPCTCGKQQLVVVSTAARPCPRLLTKTPNP